MQYELLKKGASHLKEGGILVYSTCTTEPEENSEIISKFLIEHPSFQVVDVSTEFEKDLVSDKGFLQTLPHVHGIDGSFAAKIQRIE